jgi:predicted nucleotidyltransferase component of viral defense system
MKEKVMNDAIRRMLQRYQIKERHEAERAIKEILQEIALLGLWRGKLFEHAAFYGGTALRILYGLDRFSEDLDFTLLDSKRPFSWDRFESSVVSELSSFGFEVSFKEKSKQAETPIKSAFLKTNTLHASMQVGVRNLFHNAQHPDALIRIKIEVDTAPVQAFEVESVYMREPLPVSIRVLKESSLFAGKLHAALYRAWKQRVKGRDWYDLVWFLRRGILLNARYFEAYMHNSGNFAAEGTLTVEKIKQLLTDRLESIDLEAAKEDVSISGRLTSSVIG